MQPVVEALKDQLIVSCQAYFGEPMRHPDTMAQFAQSAQRGGAGGIRCQGLSDIAAIKGEVDLPVIGLWKEGKAGVYITPTVRHARCCAAAGADIIALDATSRPRPDGLTLDESVRILKSEGLILMADCGCLDDALRARDAGFDMVSTTLAGYTPDRPLTEGPDYQMISQMINRITDTPVICEGRIHTPEEARRVKDMGAWAVVVGTAITHPQTITSWFVQAVKGS